MLHQPRRKSSIKRISTSRLSKHPTDSLKSQIEELRISLDDNERQYKLHITNRRTQNPRVFIAADTELLSI